MNDNISNTPYRFTTPQQIAESVVGKEQAPKEIKKSFIDTKGKIEKKQAKAESAVKSEWHGRVYEQLPEISDKIGQEMNKLNDLIQAKLDARAQLQKPMSPVANRDTQLAQLNKELEHLDKQMDDLMIANHDFMKELTSDPAINAKIKADQQKPKAPPATSSNPTPAPAKQTSGAAAKPQTPAAATTATTTPAAAAAVKPPASTPARTQEAQIKLAAAVEEILNPTKTETTSSKKYGDALANVKSNKLGAGFGAGMEEFHKKGMIAVEKTGAMANAGKVFAGGMTDLKLDQMQKNYSSMEKERKADNKNPLKKADLNIIKEGNPTEADNKEIAKIKREADKKADSFEPIKRGEDKSEAQIKSNIEKAEKELIDLKKDETKNAHLIPGKEKYLESERESLKRMQALKEDSLNTSKNTARAKVYNTKAGEHIFEMRNAAGLTAQKGLYDLTDAKQLEALGVGDSAWPTKFKEMASHCRIATECLVKAYENDPKQVFQENILYLNNVVTALNEATANMESKVK